MACSNRGSTRKLTRREFARSIAAIGAAGAIGTMTGCVAESGRRSRATPADTGTTVGIDTSIWRYDQENDIFYQLDVAYCTNPRAPAYERMAIYVPGAYFDASQNSNGTYTCTPSEMAAIGGFTASKAPIVLYIESDEFAAHASPSEYGAADALAYIEAGFVYVHAGFRGNDMAGDAPGGFPRGTADLKAAVRTLRANASNLAGNTGRIFSFGAGGGGAQSAILGASGMSEDYDPYLAEIGAPTMDLEGNAVSDAVFGVACWHPETCLDHADAAYEWSMGQFSSNDTRAAGTFTGLLSNDLSSSYAATINSLGLASGEEPLRLDEGGEGIFTSGTYYDHVKGIVEESLNGFLAGTAFPYTVESEPSPASAATLGSKSGGSQTRGALAPRAICNTAADYIAYLNGNSAWIAYDAASNTASIESLSGFVNACRPPSKGAPAFDALDRSSAENRLFSDDGNGSLHFDATIARLIIENSSSYAGLAQWSSAYPRDFEKDLAVVDSMGTSTEQRVAISSPLHYLLASQKGTGTPAPHWRIRAGLQQGDAPLTTEINLALAARAASGVQDVDFVAVWDGKHTAAERSGDAVSNFIAWVRKCCG